MFVNKFENGKWKIVGGFSQKNFTIFLQKLVGVMIFSGQKSYSVKNMNYLMRYFKKHFVKKVKLTFLKKQRKSLYFLLKQSIDNIMPLLFCGVKKIGKYGQPFPMLCPPAKQYRLILNWMYRNFRDRGNIRNVKNEDILKVLIESYFRQGRAYRSKRNYYKRALSGLFLLRRGKFVAPSKKLNKYVERGIFFNEPLNTDLFTDEKFKLPGSQNFKVYKKSNKVKKYNKNLKKNFN
jgi:hypothetical protein